MFLIRMIRLCAFRDRDPWFKPDSTGLNKTGYVTANDIVVYPVRRHFVAEPLQRLEKRVRGRRLMMSRRECHQETAQRVDSYFTENVMNPALMNRGMRELLGPDLGYFDHPIRLPILSPITNDEYEKRWAQLVDQIQPGDTLLVIDEKSRLSRLVAKVDMGTWSHTAICFGRGIVIEAITTGVVQRDISVYHSRNYRVGLYRIPGGVTDEQITKMHAFAIEQLGKKYAWGQIVRLGIRKLLRARPPAQLQFLPSKLSPNDLIALSILELIHVV
jgi:Permuted papain-like amidase enzyme, YaeF/YiiX, C92 family